MVWCRLGVGELHGSVGRDDENLGRSPALVSPAMPAAGGNAGGIASLEVMDLLFEGQFDGSLEDDCQLLCLPNVGF